MRSMLASTGRQKEQGGHELQHGVLIRAVEQEIYRSQGEIYILLNKRRAIRCRAVVVGCTLSCLSTVLVLKVNVHSDPIVIH